MGHPVIDNDTPLAFSHTFATDEGGRPLLVLILKATFEFDSGPRPTLCVEQLPILLAGEFHGAPGVSSYRIEPEGIFFKPATDVILLGHAEAGGRHVTELLVGMKLGAIRKIVRVTGERFWVPGVAGMPRMTSPKAFQRIELKYEHAYGGRDPNLPDSDRRAFDSRNPVGAGYSFPWRLMRQLS